ncbi:peptidoglycan editing factor PgeF [Vibrio algicola]|uniref:Purine nucleoside phosphorylase n=1 Tax=Vibrio algicola TaxID=2662262 RepID=A0A5Q0TF91_9VIBR|nr:peptidoglycan editing factor PgeF [Vibrio algicola]
MDVIIPNWPAPKQVKAISSTRIDGVSKGVYQGLNLGAHVGDDAKRVRQNRKLLTQAMQMPNPPVWLNQTHSTHVVEVNQPTATVLDADACTTQQKGVVCSAMTADCLPVLLTNIEGTQVAAVHAGWRGLADGIIEQAVKKFEHPETVMAWLGPAIGASVFEVGQDVVDIFVAVDPDAKDGFNLLSSKVASETSAKKYLADMNKLATQRLNRIGVTQVYYSNRCTVSEHDTFYSYRRDGVTGRQASFIWIE